MPHMMGGNGSPLSPMGGGDGSFLSPEGAARDYRREKYQKWVKKPGGKPFNYKIF